MGTPEVPLVVGDSIQEYKKTKEAVRFLKAFKAWEDIKKVCVYNLVNFDKY